MNTYIKSFIFMLSFVCLCQTAQAQQDSIFMKSKSVLVGNITEMDGQTISIEIPRGNNFLLRRINISDVNTIRYVDGTLERIRVKVPSLTTPSVDSPISKPATSISDADKSNIMNYASILIEGNAMPKDYAFDNAQLNAVMLEATNSQGQFIKTKNKGNMLLITGGSLALLSIFTVANRNKNNDHTFFGGLANDLDTFLGTGTITIGVLTGLTAIVPLAKASKHKKERDKQISLAQQLALDYVSKNQ